VAVTKYEGGVAIQRPYSRAPSAGRGGDGMHVGEDTVTCAVGIESAGATKVQGSGSPRHELTVARERRALQLASSSSSLSALQESA